MEPFKMKKIRFKILFAFIIISFVCTSHAFAVDSDHASKNLPKNWEGSFQWHAGGPAQKLKITISNVSVDSNGNILALGNCINDTAGKITETDVKWSINPSSLKFEMWENNPKPSTDSVTDGSYVGIISEKLDKIRAVWTTSGTGDQGSLFLEKQK